MPKFHATMKTAEAEKRMLLYIHAVPNELAREVQRLTDDAVMIFQSYAPSGPSGRLGRGIRATSAQGRSSASGRFETGRQFVITATARSREGYDYVGVTRFGHRQRFIRPSLDRQPQSVIDTRKPKRRFGHGETPADRRPALRIPSRTGGKPLYRNVVRGVVKTHDWAEAGQRAVDKELDLAAKRLAHNLTRRFG